MLNTLCILSDNWKALLHKGQLFQNPILIFQVHAATPVKDLLQFIYKPASAEGNMRFTLCFDVDGHAGADAVLLKSLCEDDTVCNFVFHPAFYRKRGAPIFFYKATNNSVSDTARHLNGISDSLRSQFYPGATYLPLYQAAAYGNENEGALMIPEDETPIEIATRYQEVFLKPGHYNKHLIVKDNEGVNEALQQRLIEAEETFFQNNQRLYKQLKQLSILEEENSYLKWKETGYLNELNSYKTFLKVIQEQGEATIINNFYYHEYEVLPLWYKRLGHIIKVMAGKRSFKSLFDKSQKKHTP